MTLAVRPQWTFWWKDLCAVDHNFHILLAKLIFFPFYSFPRDLLINYHVEPEITIPTANWLDFQQYIYFPFRSRNYQITVCELYHLWIQKYNFFISLSQHYFQLCPIIYYPSFLGPSQIPSCHFKPFQSTSISPFLVPTPPTLLTVQPAPHTQLCAGALHHSAH